MNTEKIAQTEWFPDQKLVVTQLSGDVAYEDVLAWEKSIQIALDQIRDGGIFKILVNLYGFTAVDIDTHKRYRSIIPLTLADYNWKVGYVDLFPAEAAHIIYSSKREVTCLAAAHVHQDATKIDAYEQRFSRSNERYFTNPSQAYEWIEAIDL